MIMRAVVILCVVVFPSVAAFAPQVSIVQQQQQRGGAASSFSISSSFTTTSASTSTTRLSSSSNDLDEEVERMVQQEVAKSNRMSNLRNEKGVDYAPWMKISKEDEQRIRGIMREKAVVRRRRQVSEQSVKGALLQDSTNQELSGTGMKFQIINGNAVELVWATAAETSGTKGFIVKRRAAKTPDFITLASYESYGPLASKGADGGVYRYLDENVSPGGWFYRITEVDDSAESDLSQCLVEIETQEEQKSQLVALVGLATIALAAVAAGVLSDPLQY
jgi:hypothetical protein